MVVKSEKSTFESFASKAIRGPRKGIYEHLLCQHLIAAVSSRPLRKIRLLCEAVLMLPDPKSVDIDMDKIDVMYTIARAFQQSSHYKFAAARYVCVPWPLEDTEENYTKYIAVWKQEVDIQYYPILYVCYNEYEREKYETARQKVTEEVASMPFWQRFLYMTRKGRVTEQSYDNLVSQFTAWALPKVQQTFVKVAKQINPTLYQEILHSINQQNKELTVEKQTT